MLRSVGSRVMWVGRATVFLVGLAVILALVVGVVSRATAHDGFAGLFHLGHNNPVGALSTLTKSGKGPALSLKVDSGPPLAVNSSAKVAKLNADEVDGRDATMWAKVAANGNATSSYGVTASSKTPMEGSYRVQFIRDPSQCATTATIAADGQGGDVYASGGILTEPNAVLVETFDSRGLRADRPFSLAVFC